VLNRDDGTIYLLARTYVVPATALFFRRVEAGKLVSMPAVATTGNTSFDVLSSPITLVGPQAGTNQRMDCGLPMLHYAVLRRGVLWIIEGGYMPTPTRATVRWWKANIASTTTAQSGLIDDPTGRNSFAFPSIAVNGAGAVLIGYSFFDPE